jgi:DNA repair protein RecN (Recombination protein N)
MIRELHIRNLALIDDITVEFDKGFSVFTGETGAGKSILIGAIGLLLGERASTEMVRSGADEAEVNGVFELGAPHKAFADLLEELTITPDNGTLIIRRKIAKNDRNRILVNQVPLPLSSLKRLGDLLIDFHGQHEHQSLLNEETHRDIIDELPGVKDSRNSYTAAYEAYAAAKNALDEYEIRAKNLTERRDILEFQFNELKALALNSGEEEDLEKEFALLSSSAQRAECVSTIIGLIGNSTDSLEHRIVNVKKKLETLSKYDPSVSQWIADVGNTLSVFTELETFCGSYLEKTGNNADPDRIEFINSRLAKIQRLKKKYACSHEQLIERQKELENSLMSIENIDADRALLEKKTASSLQKCVIAGKALTAARKKASQDFDSRVTAQMAKLGFVDGEWNTVFESLQAPTSHGFEEVRFLVRTNPGEPFLSLAKTASGGEISRLMLAIKKVMAEHDVVPVLIFDEIDSGIGGLLAGEIGKSLYALSRSHQVLCISHLHQIASMADNHYHVYKETSNDRTVTRVKVLDEKEKVNELARMLGGDSEITRKHAKELLKGKGTLG